jgi:hypothetical protein
MFLTKFLRGSVFLLVVVFVMAGFSGANAFVINDPGNPTDGWDGPGLGSVTIDYYVGNPSQPNDGLPAGFSLPQFETVLLAAMGTWSSVVQIGWNKVGDFTDGGANQFLPNDINVYAASGDHGDGFPFDGPFDPGAGTGSVYAHAFGPPDIAGGSGNIHLDADENWVTTGHDFRANDADIDLQSILLHELGHSLGLGHEDSMGQGPGAPIMQSFQNVDGTWARTLTADDIAGVQSLYAAVGGPPPNGIPEPNTLLLLGTGGILLALRRSRKGK